MCPLYYRAYERGCSIFKKLGFYCTSCGLIVRRVQPEAPAKANLIDPVENGPHKPCFSGLTLFQGNLTDMQAKAGDMSGTMGQRISRPKEKL
jgi:hypothetical protein